MKCPRCEEGTLKLVELKNNNALCIICDFCNTFWEKGETVSQFTGKPFEDFAEGDEREFHIKPIDDEENRSAKFTNVR